MDITWNKHKLGLTCKIRGENPVKNTLIAAHDPVKCTLVKASEWTRQFHNHRLASTLVILVVYLSPKQTNLGTTWVGVPTEETPYISHFCKRYEIDVLIAYT